MFEAGVDGYLCSRGDKQIKAIIKVKAPARVQGVSCNTQAKKSVQMAAWIANRPNPTEQAIDR